MNSSKPLQTEPEIGNDCYYAASAVSPNAHHQDKYNNFVSINHVAKTVPNAAHILEDQDFEVPESQQPYLDCITWLGTNMFIFMRGIWKSMVMKLMYLLLWQQFNILRLFFRTKMMKSLTMNPQMMMMSIHAFRTLQRLPSSQKIFLERFLTVQSSTGCLKYVIILNFVFVHVQFIPNHGRKKGINSWW